MNASTKRTVHGARDKLARTGLLIAAVSGSLLLAGCGSYYMVRDPGSGTTYYTDDLDRRSGGAVEFTDDATGDKVTLQSSEVTKISRNEYKRNLHPAK